MSITPLDTWFRTVPLYNMLAIIGIIYPNSCIGPANHVWAVADVVENIGVNLLLLYL
jgi:hypothetical protein